MILGLLSAAFAAKLFVAFLGVSTMCCALLFAFHRGALFERDRWVATVRKIEHCVETDLEFRVEVARTSGAVFEDGWAADE